MRFLFFTPPAAHPLPEFLKQVRRLANVKILNFDAKPGMEGVGMLEAHSEFDAEDFARTFGRKSGGSIRLLPL